MKRTKEIFRDNKWLVLKPLTLNASIKYGYNTKWCTSSKDNPKTFYKYSMDGILIYIIERKTNIKWAVHWEINELRKKCEMSWWNAEDDRLDSMLVTIPEYVMNTIKRELVLESKPNYHYFSENQKNNYEKLNKLKSTSDSSSYDWGVYRNDGIWHTTDTLFNPISPKPTSEGCSLSKLSPVLDVDEAVRKTLEHKHISDAYLKLIKQITDTKEVSPEEDS